MSKVLPYHYRDNGEWCRFSEVTVADEASCPNGCEGALHHYANDGHEGCNNESRSQATHGLRPVGFLRLVPQHIDRRSEQT